MSVQIDKVIMSLQDVDNMEKINDLTEVSFDTTDNWIDFSTIEDIPELKEFITDEEYNALKNKEADFIAFRLD